MKKSLKIVSIMMMAIMMIMVATPVFAANETLKGSESVIGALDSKADDQSAPSELTDLAGTILGFLRNASYIIGALVLVIIGIKYMMGSLEEKADYKKSMIPLVVGIIVVVSATTIAKFLFDTFKISG